MTRVGIVPVVCRSCGAGWAAGPLGEGPTHEPAGRPQRVDSM